jgi:dipeptidase E
MPEPTILAMGGGGFSSGADHGRLMDDFMLELTGQDTPKVCWVPTASGDADDFTGRFYEVFGGGRAKPSHLALFMRDVADLEAFLLGQDAIYVGGGNTANMLAVWRVHGVDRILAEAWRRGIVLGGLSAGGLCWFEGGSTDSFGGLAALRDGLGFLAGSFCPHYDSEERRRSTYHEFVRDGMPAGYAAQEFAALRFSGRELVETVASCEDSHAFRVEANGGDVVERELECRGLWA